jgi:hypothetical protein
MSFLSVLLGCIIGGVISEGAMLGLAFLGKMVAWWLALILGGVGCMVGGFVGGLIARGAGSGAIAGFLTGIIVFLVTFLIIWLILKSKILTWWDDLGTIDAVIDELLFYLQIPDGEMADNLRAAITEAYNQYGIEEMVNKYFVVFALIIGAIFGGICAVVNIFAGLVGGLITRKKEEDIYESYY